MRDEYLKTGRVPFGLMLQKGLKSLLLDPWRMFFQYLPGPVGMKSRQVLYRRSFGHLGRGVVIDPCVDFIGSKNIHLDDFCYIGRLSQLVAPEGYIHIGKRCHLGCWIIGHGGVEIGDYVAGGANILSATDSHKGGHRMSGPMIPPEQRRVRKAKVIVEDDAFLGHFSTIMPGTHIGQGAVIAPNSLVMGRIKPWTVVMGNPAKKVGEREPVRFPTPDQ